MRCKSCTLVLVVGDPTNFSTIAPSAMVRENPSEWPAAGGKLNLSKNASCVLLLLCVQGSEILQREAQACFERMEFYEPLINCSAGREWDEQHCWFSGHFLKSRNLTIHYDYLQPMGIFLAIFYYHCCLDRTA